ncbi:MAG: hypothetical protein ACREBO_02405 [Novosphingobium sp.]
MRIDSGEPPPLPSRAGRRAQRGPWSHLLSALLELAEGETHLLDHTERAWASITFTGARHTVTLAFTGDAAIASGERFVAALPEHEFAIPGQIVADAAVLAVEHRLLPKPCLTVEVELLLLEDC